MIEPRNPLTPTEISSATTAVTRFPSAGYSFRPARHGDEPLALSAQAAIYPNVGTDTDYIVQSDALGAEVSFQLRSAASPEQLSLLVDLPPGGRLVTAPAGSDPPETVEVDAKGGRAVGYVFPPVAYDADGTSVPAVMRFSGDRIDISVPHRGLDVRYPLLVDPVASAFGSYSWGWPGWGWGQTTYGGAGFSPSPYANGGLYQQTQNNQWYATGAYAIWYYQAPPGSYIDDAQLNGLYHSPLVVNGTNYTRGFAGVMNQPFTAWEAMGYTFNGGTWNAGANPFITQWGYSNANLEFCFDPACDDVTTTDEQNYALDGLQAYSATTNALYTGSSTGWSVMQQAQIWLGDNHAPSITPPRGSDTGWRALGNESFTLAVQDSGVGLEDVSVTDDRGYAIDSPGDLPVINCNVSGINGGTCPTSYQATVHYVPDEGSHTYTVTATDADGNVSAYRWTEMVDGTGPQLTLGGGLPGQDGKQVTENALELDVTAADGLSGVQKVTVSVDGQQKLAVSGAAASQPVSWIFNPDSYGSGKHVIAVAASDNVGNQSTHLVTVTVHHSATTAVGPGELNLADGNLQVTRTDVDVSAFRTPLDVTRTFNSRASDDGAGGPLGPGWQLGVSIADGSAPWSQLTDYRTAEGFVAVTDTVGNEYDFVQDGAAATGFDPPPEDPGLRLKANSSGFELDDPDGTATFFAQQSVGGVYTPSQIVQPGSNSTTTYGYNVVANGDTQLAYVLAPVPAGVTCSPPGWAPGCRALTFDYASSTTATGTSPSQWGDVAGLLKSITLWAADPNTGHVTSTAVAAYLYDAADGLPGGSRLRAEWDPRISPALQETYTYDSSSHAIASIAPPGLAAWTMSYKTFTGSGGMPADTTPGRLSSIGRSTPAGTATTTIAYNVPLSGSGAPYQMSSTDVAAWAQKDLPTQATAIFPPDQVPGSDPPSSWTRATIHYLDGGGREVNVAEPGGRIATTEYDATHDVVTRQLDAEDRARSLTASNPAAQAALLDTEMTYSPDFVDLTSTTGPQHSTRVNGQTVQARKVTQYTYNENAPATTGAPYHLVTKIVTGAAVAGTSGLQDARTTTYAYSGSDTSGNAGAGWTWRTPTAETRDAGGKNLTTTYVLDAATGQVADRILPAGPSGGGDAHDRHTDYYAAGNSSAAGCGTNPALATLPCRTYPKGQPGTSGLPTLPTTTYGYNSLWEPTTTTATSQDSAGSHTKATSNTYDGAGRLIGSSVSSDSGVALPSQTFAYDPATGLPTTTSTTDSTGTKTVARGYDIDGRQNSYKDADSATASTTTYDIDGRIATVNDGKGTQTISYDQLTGDATGISDTGAGTFSGSYDANGRMVTETMPGGLQEQLTYDEAGNETEVRYVKTTSCSSGCTWFDSTLVRNVHGQVVDQNSTLSHQVYTYDGTGRITDTQDTPVGQGCTTRHYDYDADSNRLKLTTRSPGTGGACDTTSTGNVTSHSYDAADRLTDSGVTYDPFGRITALPAADAGGTPLTASYFVDDRVRSLVQATRTRTYDLDPLRRIRVRTVVDPANGGKTTTTVTTYHYTDDSDSPAWTAESADGTQWTRNVLGLDGELVAIQDNTGAITLQIANAHGDIVGTATTATTAKGLSATFDSDEFGVPRSSASGRYRWLGAYRRASELPTGIVAMGQRLYVPALGRFLQVDPVLGGSATDYDYGQQDPVNSLDLGGQCVFDKDISPPNFTRGRYNYWELCGPNGHRTGYLRTRAARIRTTHGRSLFGRITTIVGGAIISVTGVAVGAACVIGGAPAVEVVPPIGIEVGACVRAGATITGIGGATIVVGATH